jgi:hypothetical protein
VSSILLALAWHVVRYLEPYYLPATDRAHFQQSTLTVLVVVPTHSLDACPSFAQKSEVAQRFQYISFESASHTGPLPNQYRPVADRSMTGHARIQADVGESLGSGQTLS